MPLDTKSSPIPGASHSNELELDMRRALGLGAASHGHNRRFAKEGEVPVVVLRNRRDGEREAAEATSKAEQDARERAEHALAAARDTIRNLQTKLAHSELALDEAREALGRITSEKRALKAELVDQTNDREDAEDRLRREVADHEAGEQRPRLLHSTAGPAHSLSPKRRRVKKSPDATGAIQPQVVRKARPQATSFEEDQEPVDWWSKHEKK
jgi:ClpP class serine protease